MKFTNDYEKIFTTAYDAIHMTDKLSAVIEVLRKADKPMSAKELGHAMIGGAYDATPDNYGYHRTVAARSLSGYLGKVLPMLAQHGWVERSFVDGEPRTFIEEECFRVSENGEPDMITVWDANGHEYRISNPNYHYFNSHVEWRKTERTVTPKVKVWKWVGD